MAQVKAKKTRTKPAATQKSRKRATKVAAGEIGTSDDKSSKRMASRRSAPAKKTAGARIASAADEFRSKSEDELSHELLALLKEQFNLRFQRANGQLEKTNRVRVVRRNIARVQTVLNERRRAQGM